MLKKLLLILFIFVGCTSKKDKLEPLIINVTEVAKEQQIPKQLMLELDSDLGEEFKNSPPLFSFYPLQVKLLEHNQSVLKKPSVIYNFPKGGGLIDLKDVLTGQGSFYFSFPAEQFDENHELLHLYYMSNSPKIKIENDEFGTGCGKWVDLKSNFKKFKSEDYLKLNTHDLRYLRVLAGTYVFIFKQAKNIFLSQLTITDSRYTTELCLGGDQ